jgi:hypothetical protein
MMKDFATRAVVIFMLLISCSTAQAQEEIDQFLNASASDAEKLIKAYLSPFANGVSSGMNQGWYNTAKPHKVAGFDLTITVNAMFIPDDEMFYNVAKLDLEVIRLSEESPDYRSATIQNAPTVIGPDRAPIFEATEDGVTEEFSGPPGLNIEEEIGMSVVPVPMVNLGFGLPKGTDIKLRFLPSLGLGDDANINLFGLGVMHDVKQWIPGMKTLPFDLSAFAGYTRLMVKYDVPEDEFSQNGRGELAMSAFTLQGLISKKISVLTLYGGVGYNVAKSNLKMLGQYDINGDGNFNGARETNPVDIGFSASGPRVTGGFRLKLAVITLHADYTLQKYSALSIGFGINVR